jgi:hypothetical protein
MANNMSADNLKHNLTNPARSYLWEVMFPNPIGGGDAEVLEIRCQSANIPGRSFGEIKIPFKASPGIKFPGKLTMSQTWVTTFVEGVDKKVFDALHAWQQTIIHDRLGVGGPDILTKADIYLRLLDTQGNVFQKIRFVGAYPQAVDDIPVAYEDEKEIRYNVTWSYDFWEEVA